MIWDQLTSTQLGTLDRNIPVLLNIAATEQHGAHLPLATDRLIGERFSFALHEEIPDRILILPAVPIGCSDHHMDFPGSLTLSHATFISVVKDIIQSVLHHGFKKIILLNSHGGNQGVMQVIIEQIGYANPDVYIAGVTWWRLAIEDLKKITETGPGGTGHACEFETSLIQTIAGHLVDYSQIQKGANAAGFRWADGDMLQGPAVSYYRSMKTLTANGIFGDPRQASAQKGMKIISCVVKALQQVATDLYSINSNKK